MLLTERTDDNAQCEKASIDIDSFFSKWALCTCLVRSFSPSKVHQVQLPTVTAASSVPRIALLQRLGCFLI
jgi:hypothetical protein